MKNYKELLSEFISFKTVSSTLLSREDVKSCIEWLESLLKTNEFETIVSDLENSNPIVFGEYHLSDKAETVLLYGHYDVQPANDLKSWKGNPFNLIDDKGSLYARGVADNKGQILIHLYTIFELIKKRTLKYNIKVIIEGNEETGSKFLPDFIENNKEILKADFIVISDGELSNNNPTLEIGFRGNANLSIELKSAISSVHSGMFGNSVPNSIVEISKLISSIYNDNYSINIGGLFGGIDESNNKYQELISPNNLAYKKIIKNLQFKKTFAKDDFEFQYQNGLMPSLIITGINGGHYEEGYANIVPNRSKIKINVRFAPFQEADIILKNLEEEIKRKINPYIDYEINYSSITQGIVLDIDNNYFTRVKGLLEKVYKKECVYKFVGGSLPIINSFIQHLEIPLLSIPLANSNCNMHGVNENFSNRSLFLAKRFCSMLYTG